MNWFELIGAAIGLVYLWLEYRANVWLWVAGIIMPAIYIFVYYDAGLYADMGISVYYVVAGLYGLAVWLGRMVPKWRRHETGGQEPVTESLPISRTPASRYLVLGIVCVGIFALISLILIRFTDSDVPLWDSFTTALSVIGLWMLTRKYVEQWLVWIVVDAVSSGLYIYKELYPTAILYGLYTVIAVFGYFKWLRMMKEQNENYA